MKVRKLLFLLGVVFFSVGMIQVSRSACKNLCFSTAECVRDANFHCWLAQPGSCIARIWIRNGVGNAGFVCENVGDAQSEIKDCIDCNPECPEEGTGEANECSGCTPYRWTPRKRCVAPANGNSDSGWN
jgi:hypothetical protein